MTAVALAGTGAGGEHSRMKLKALLLTAPLACLLVAAAPAQGAWPGRDGAIVFSREASRTHTYDLWIAHPSGRQRRLTNTPQTDETAPTFSPDGRLIAYVHWQRHGEDADVWVMNRNGSDPHVVAATDGSDLEPSFYPSGRSLAFSVYNGGALWTAHSVRADGSHLQLLARSATYPVISPNGRWLAYSRQGNGGGIRLRDLRSGDERQLTTGSAQGLDFSPDGRRLLFVGQRRCHPGVRQLRFSLMTMALNGKHPTFLRRSCNSEVAGAAWSPNGRRIVWVRKTWSGRRLSFRLRMMSAGGSALGGAPAHRPGSEDLYPSWQPLR